MSRKKQQDRPCPRCNSSVPEGKQFCQNCLFNYGYWITYGMEYKETGTSKRIDSTYKKRFMFDDKKWTEDIRNRRTLADGSVGRFKRTRSGSLERYE